MLLEGRDVTSPVSAIVLQSRSLVVRRNLRLGRGDRRGAFRLAAFVFGAWAVAWFFGAHHVSNFAEIGLFLQFMLWGLGFSGSTGFSTLPWSPMCVAVGPPRLSPGPAWCRGPGSHHARIRF